MVSNIIFNIAANSNQNYNSNNLTPKIQKAVPNTIGYIDAKNLYDIGKTCRIAITWYYVFMILLQLHRQSRLIQLIATITNCLYPHNTWCHKVNYLELSEACSELSVFYLTPCWLVSIALQKCLKLKYKISCIGSCWSSLSYDNDVPTSPFTSVTNCTWNMFTKRKRSC